MVILQFLRITMRSDEFFLPMLRIKIILPLERLLHLHPQAFSSLRQLLLLELILFLAAAVTHRVFRYHLKCFAQELFEHFILLIHDFNDFFM